MGGFWHRLRGERAYRCRTCRKRFYVSDLVGEPRPVEPKREHKHKHHRGRDRRSSSLPKLRHLRASTRRRLVEAAVFLVMLVVFYVFLRYIVQERPAGEPSAALAGPSIQLS